MGAGWKGYEMNKKQKLVIVGVGEFALIADEYFTYDSDYEVIAFSAERAFIGSETLNGKPVVPFETLEEAYNPQEYLVYVAVTSTKLNRVRTRLYREAKRKGYRFVNYISSRAFVWRNVKIGENCFIFEDNTLQPFVEIGNNVVIWSGNHIGHRTIIKDHCFLSSHSVISGYCEIGENCFLGVNSTFADNVKVAKDCLIGAGAVVTKNTEEGKIYVGNPAKPSPVGSLRYSRVDE